MGEDLFFFQGTTDLAKRHCERLKQILGQSVSEVLVCCKPPPLPPSSRIPLLPFFARFLLMFFSPIMTACAIIIMRLTELNRAQASYCAVKKFNPSINCV